MAQPLAINMSRHTLSILSGPFRRSAISYQIDRYILPLLDTSSTSAPFYVLCRHIFFLYPNTNIRLKSTNCEPSDKAWKLRTNYYNDHHNKEIFGPIRKHTTDRRRTKWTEEEELDVLKKEVELKRKNQETKS